VLCVIDRRPPGMEDVLGAAGLTLHALFNMAELKEAGAAGQ
jgi:orotate phosphoribosyltransferase